MRIYTVISIITLIGTMSVFSLNPLAAQCTIQGPTRPLCASEDVDFSVANAGNNSYEWDMNDDGEIDLIGTRVSYRFPATGQDRTYTIRLYQEGELCGTRDVEILATADPAIGIPANGGILEDGVVRVCSGVPSVNISIFNNSSTINANASYRINWGDGSPVEQHDNSTFNSASLLTHTYEGFGFYDLTVSVESDGSICDNVGEFQVYIGSNPSVGLGTPGNTVGLCAPVTLTFPITGTADNPAGTRYDVLINGETVASYTQENVPEFYTHTFTESSCGQTTSTGNYQNAFDLQIIASNPCGSSTATVEPIEVSESPVAMFTVLDSLTCSGRTLILQNASVINEVVSGSPSRCQSEIAASWDISPGTAGDEWVVVDGNLFSSDRIEVDFNEPGTYQVTITINSPSCGSASFTDEITIAESPRNAGVSLTTDARGGCAPGIVTLINRTEGADLTYNWKVRPGRGWFFEGGTDASSENPIINVQESGEYRFIMEAGNACGTVTWDTILTFKGPPTIELSPPPDACLSAELNLDETLVSYDDQGNAIFEYYWEFPGADPSASFDPYPTGIAYDGVGEYAYRVAATNTCGTTIAENTLRVVEPAPVRMPDIGEVCESAGTISLQPNPRGGIWSGPGVSADGKFRPAEAGVGTHTLDYRFGEGLCSVEGSMTIVVTPPPQVDAGPNINACAGGGAIDLPGTPVGGQWSAEEEWVENNRFYPGRSGIGTFRAYYTYTDPQGCSVLDSLNVIVREVPEVSVDDLTFCEGPGLVPLPAGIPAGGSWVGPGVTNDNQFDPAAAGGVGTYNLRYRFTDNRGCTGSAVSKVTVVGGDLVEAGPDLVLCASDSPVDLAPGASPGGGRWRSSGGGLTGSVFDPSRVTPGRLTVSYEVGVGNCVLKDELVIDVVASPAIDFSEVPTFICDTEEQVTLEATPAGGRWRAGEGAVLVDNVFDAAASGPGRYTFTYTFRAGSCQVTESIEVRVGSVPEVEVRDSIYCDGPGRVRLPVAQPEGGRWFGPGVEGRFFYPRRAGGVGLYNLEYRYNNGGCIVSAESTIEVIPALIVEAGPDNTLCLVDGAIELNGFSPEGGRWSGPGVSDDRLAIFDPAEAGGGAHELIYTVGNAGCVVRDTITLTVVEPLPVNAGAAMVFCPDDAVVSLTGASPGGGQWSGPAVSQGRFDPGATRPGEYQLRYSVTDEASGCVTTAERPVTVHPKPTSIFQAPPITCTDETLEFANQSIGATDFRWDFGDGATSAAKLPAHTYANRGAFTVKLIASNDFGCSDTLSQVLDISLPPEAFFEPDVDSGCSSVEVEFDNRSVGDGAVYSWNFGNGEQSSNPNPPAITFDQGTQDTSYVVSLTVRNQCATSAYQDTITVLPKPIADFGVPVDTSCSPMEVTFFNRTVGLPDWFQWDLGNGVTTTDSLPPDQVYQTDTTTSIYTITLIAGNSCGQDTASRQLYVTPTDVNAFFNVPELQGCAPYDVQFTNLATVGAFVSWDFGDGTVSSEQNPVYTFSDPGTYTVKQYAASECGLDSIDQTLTVLPAPDVAFDHPDFECVDAPVTFENLSAGIMGQWWYFGDGDSSQLRSPVHAFSAPGSYTVVLRGISQMNGCPAVDTSVVTILGRPEASFQPSIKDGCAPLQVDFENFSAADGYFYTWDFGDGNTSTLDNPRHRFENDGVYEVRLRVSDANGCAEDTTVQNIIVHPLPDVDFSFDPEIGCGLPATINIDNLTTGAAGFRWDFGDGTSSSFNEPGAHQYFEGREYDITLIATNTFQCADTLTKTVDIFPFPQARYEIQGARGCSPFEVTFQNLSSANHYYWDFGDGSGSIVANPVHCYTQPGKYDVRLVVSYDDICYDTLLLENQVEVLPTPHADFDYEPNTDPDASPGAIKLYNLSEGATKFFWEFGDGCISEEVHPEYRFLTNGTQEIYLEAINIYGCVDDTLRVIESPLIKGLFIPNAFSPEAGIGEVRLFKPKGVGLKSYHVRVFSPYGELIWESTALEDGQPAEAWDGTLNGQLLPQDVYVWKAYGIFEDGSSWKGMPDGNGNFMTIGSLTLLR